jgi:hypothetical protein
MRKPGRPRKNGEKPFWMLARETVAVYAYDQARKTGEKHSGAISEAVMYIRATYPRMPVSETEVKRILAVWRSKNRSSVLFVSKPGPEHNSRTLPDGRKVRILYTASVGPRPVYPRANAAEQPEQSNNPNH